MIAIFGALAGFLFSLNKPTNDENLVFGILFLISLMGLLITIIFYDSMITFFSLIRQKDETFFTTFQTFFIVMFLILFLMFFFSLITYLYSNYSDWVLWMALAIFLYFVLICGAWFNTAIRNIIGSSNGGLVLTIFGYTVIVIWILSSVYHIIIGLTPHSSNIAELTHASQTVFFFSILLTHSISSILYFTGTLIKRIFMLEKPPMAEEVI